MQLAKREKFFISMAVGVLVGILIIQFAILPFVDRKERYRNSLAAKQQDLQEMIRLQQEYLVLQQDSDILAKRLASRPENFTL